MIEPKIEISDEMSANYFATCEGMRMRDLGPPEQYLLQTFLELSFLMNKTGARVISLQKLAETAYLHKGNLRRYIDSLVKAEIVIERFDCGCFYYEVKPDWQQWRIRRRHTHQEDAEAAIALRWLRDAPDPNQLELIERPADFDAEISRAFATASVVQPPVDFDGSATARVVSSTPPPGQFQPRVDDGGYRPGLPGFEEQMGRLERIAPEAKGYRFWWRKHAGRDPRRLLAMRQTLDDYVTNREPVSKPIAWIISTFKNKASVLAPQE